MRDILTDEQRRGRENKAATFAVYWLGAALGTDAPNIFFPEVDAPANRREKIRY